MICSFCGIENCNDLFMKAISKEFENTEYGKVHHITVPSYNLQHNLYSKEGWFAVRECLTKFLNNELTPEMARKINNINTRDYSITKGEKLIGLENINWSLTIANINFDLSSQYCIDIKKWAKSVLKDTEQIAINKNK